MAQHFGNNVSRGIAIGKAYLYSPFKTEIKKTTIPIEKAGDVIASYNKAKKIAEAELLKIKDKLVPEKEEKAKIFAAQLNILFDVTMNKDILNLIESKGYCAEFAINSVYEKYAGIIEKVVDPLVRERAADIRDVKYRLLQILSGAEKVGISNLNEPAIIVADNLLPSDTATLDRKNVLAFVTQTGGETSHTAIIAKSYGIPAVLGIRDIMSLVKHGETIIVDALNGTVYTDPTKEQIILLEKEQSNYIRKSNEEKEFLKVVPFTKDGLRIGIYLNIGTGRPEELQSASYLDGVGLFRTEFLYMERPQYPTEEEQFIAYRKVLSSFGEKPVTLRTLDIGGDKTMDYFNLKKEDNPFLGKRALRLCFDRPEIFRTQLKAALRASVFGNLWIMFPMVGSLDDIRKAKSILEEAKAELHEKQIPYNKNIKIGIMIEIPSIAMIADKVAKEVDFASIGTNDLCQYLLAVDRMNPDVTEYYQSYHPAMYRLIGYVTDEFMKQGKPLSVCGELCSDMLAPAVLVGLGITKLSMNISAVASKKKLITSLTAKQTKKLADTVLELSTAKEVKQYIKEELKDLL